MYFGTCSGTGNHANWIGVVSLYKSKLQGKVISRKWRLVPVASFVRDKDSFDIKQYFEFLGGKKGGVISLFSLISQAGTLKIWRFP